jgi:hypothetical protein
MKPWTMNQIMATEAIAMGYMTQPPSWKRSMRVFLVCVAAGAAAAAAAAGAASWAPARAVRSASARVGVSRERRVVFMSLTWGCRVGIGGVG